jgi:hypothetical protein
VMVMVMTRSGVMMMVTLMVDLAIGRVDGVGSLRPLGNEPAPITAPPRQTRTHRAGKEGEGNEENHASHDE